MTINAAQSVGLVRGNANSRSGATRIVSTTSATQPISVRPSMNPIPLRAAATSNSSRRGNVGSSASTTPQPTPVARMPTVTSQRGPSASTPGAALNSTASSTERRHEDDLTPSAVTAPSTGMTPRAPIKSAPRNADVWATNVPREGKMAVNSMRVLLVIALLFAAAAPGKAGGTARAADVAEGAISLLISKRCEKSPRREEHALDWAALVYAAGK